MLKLKIIEYLSSSDKSDKVIKSKEIKYILSSLFSDIFKGNSNSELKQKLNFIVYDISELPKCYCGNHLQFVSKEKSCLFTTQFGGWREFCSITCSRKSTSNITKREKTNLERYGEISFAKTQEFKTQFSEKWSTEKKEIFNKKAKKTYNEKYGVDHFSKTAEYIEKRTATCLEKYSVKNTFQLLDKVREGQLKKFDGNTSWIQTEQGKKFLAENNPMSIPEIARKSTLTRLIKDFSNVPEEFVSCIINNDKETFISIIDSLFDQCDKERLLVARKLNIGYSTLCRYIRNFNVQDRYISLTGAPSIAEREIYEFIKQFFPDIIQGNRTLLGDSRELDIFIPSKNLAIEYNGVYYHSEYFGSKDFKYHLSKTDLCEDKGIQLLHIFDDEWNNPIKQEILKSMILHKLGISENKIYARKCQIKDVLPQVARIFLDTNHLSGFKGAKFHKGLFLNNDLVSIMSIGEEQYSNNKNYEITRFASKLNTSVVGGLSKLFKSFNLEKPVISFADRRFSSKLNSSYFSIFDSYSITPPSWFGFHKSDFKLNHRLYYTKQKLQKLLPYDESKSSYDNMLLNGYDRIWDCGNIKFFNK